METAEPSWYPALAGWFAERPFGSVCGVFGLPQQGKSRAMKAADRRGAFKRRVVFDPYFLRDRKLYTAGASPAAPWPGLWTGYGKFVKHSAQLLDRRELRVVVDPETLEPEKLGQRVSRVIEQLWHTGNLDFIGEEAGLYTRWAVAWCNVIASGGGHARMRAWWILQEWARLLADVRDNLNTCVFFSPVGGRHLGEIQNKCGPQLAARLATLRPGDPPVCWARELGVFRP